MTYEIYKKEMAELMKNHSGKEDSTKIIEAARDELDHHFEAGEPIPWIVTIPVPVEKSFANKGVGAKYHQWRLNVQSKRQECPSTDFIAKNVIRSWRPAQ